MREYRPEGGLSFAPFATVRGKLLNYSAGCLEPVWIYQVRQIRDFDPLTPGQITKDT